MHVAERPRFHSGMLRVSNLQVEFGLAACVSNRGTAAVIDGARILVTPLRTSVVPPPMCAAQLNLPAAARCVAFCDFGSAEVCLV